MKKAKYIKPIEYRPVECYTCGEWHPCYESLAAHAIDKHTDRILKEVLAYGKSV